MDGERLLSVQQLADRLGGVTRRTVHRWLADGTLPLSPIRLHGRQLFRETELSDWIARGCPRREDSHTEALT